MNCLAAKKILFLKETKNNIVDGDYMMAKRHVADCRQCQQLLEQEEQFQKILKKKLPGQPAPTALRENILSAIAEERMHKTKARRKTILPRSAYLSGIAAVVLLSIVMYSSYSFIFQKETAYLNPALSTLIQDHISSKLRENPFDLQTSDRRQLARWFVMRVDFAMNIPQLDNTTLLGGRLCLVAGERVASLIFQKETVPITMYIMDRDVIDLSKMGVIAAIDKRRVFHGDAKGCNIILWEEKGLVYGLVSDMNEHELVKLVAKS